MAILNGMIANPRILQLLAQQAQQAQQAQARPAAGPPAAAPSAAPSTMEPAAAMPDVPVVDPSISAPADIPDDAPPPGWDFSPSDGVYTLDDGTHKLRMPAADVPPEVTSWALRKYPAPGVISSGKDQYKVEPDGKILKQALGKWGEVPEDVMGTLPEEVRKLYVEAKSKTDAGLSDKIFTQPTSGNITPNQDQIKQQEQNIHGISEALSEDSKLQGIYSPETLAVAQQKAAAVLEAAKSSGDKATIEAAKKRVAELKDTHITATPDGGYIAFIPNPVGGGYTRQVLTPKEPKKGGAYDWTQDPLQTNIGATARAAVDNRLQAQQQSNNTMLNANAQRLIKDYIGQYAQYYRQQQLAGTPLGHAAPDIMVQRLAEEMKTNPEAAVKTVQEMQKALAEVYGKGYMAITPGIHAQSFYNDGKMDPRIAIIPEQPQRGFTSQTSTIEDPNKRSAKDMKEAQFTLPDYMGKENLAPNATQSVVDNAGVDPNRTKAVLEKHKSRIYKNAAAFIPNYVVPSKNGGLEARPDAADMDTAFDQWVQGKLMQNGGNNEFKKKYIESVASAMEQAASKIALDAQSTNAATTAREDEEGNPLGTSTKKKAPVLDSSHKDKAMTELFGAPKARVLRNGRIEEHDWDEPGIIREHIQSVMLRPKTVLNGKEIPYPDSHGNNPNALSKTISMIEGVATGRNSHIELDTRLRSAAPHVMNAMQGLLDSEAEEFMRANENYFVNNLQTGTGDNLYRPAEVWGAAKSTLIGSAVWKQMGMVLK